MRIVTIICWIITALALTGVAVWFLTGTVFGIGSDRRASNWFSGLGRGGWEVLSGPYNPVGVYNQAITGVDSLKIDWIAGDVTVKPFDGSDIQITEFAQRELRANEKLYISATSGTLTIKYVEQNNLSRLPQKKLEVLVPQALIDNNIGYTVGSVSGLIFVENITADTLKATSTSGSINITNSAAQTLIMGSTSGSLTMANVQADSMNLGSISGAIHVSGSTAKTLDCSTTSGRINVSGDFDSVKQDSISGKLILDNTASVSNLEANSTSGALELSGAFEKVNAKSMSGSIHLKSTIIPGALKADTTSGSINITIPSGDAITVDHSSVSGSFSSGVPVITQKNGAQFKLTSISGSNKINKL